MDIGQPRSMTLLWASLMSDNEVMITNFLSTGQWDYESFASIMKKFHATAVFNSAVAKGKVRDVHLSTVIQLILTTAKGFWLRPTAPLREVLRTAMAGGEESRMYPFSSAIGPDLYEFPTDLWERARAKCIDAREFVALKKRLGGFYLLYTLFFKQPYDAETLIPMTLHDYDCFEHFEEGLTKLFPKDDRIMVEYRFMLNRLKVYGAFESQVEEDVHDMEYSIRIFLNTKKDRNVELLQLCKQLQDENCHDGTPRAAAKKFLEYTEQKAALTEKIKFEFKAEDTPTPMQKQKEANVKEEVVTDDETTVATNAEKLTEKEGLVVSKLKASTLEISELITNAMIRIKAMGDFPIFTRGSLLGNDTVERVFSSEATRRKDRVQIKEKKTTAAQRYDRDIFGSQKVSHRYHEQDDDDDDDDDDRRDQWTGNTRRGRSQAANNLWTHYIPENYDFYTTKGEEDDVRGDKDAKKKVGRPRKSDEPGSAKPKTPKKDNKKVTAGKKLGRPRKSGDLDYTPTSKVVMDGTIETKVGRRGRPRKSEVTVTGEGKGSINTPSKSDVSDPGYGSDKTTVPMAKPLKKNMKITGKKRGRPRKIPVVAVMANTDNIGDTDAAK